MGILSKLISCRLAILSLHLNNTSLKVSTLVLPPITFGVRKMSQKSITSFFKITPKKPVEIKQEKNEDQDITNNESSSNENSPNNTKTEKRSSKRPRLDSSGSESPSASASPQTNSGKKNKGKRQRIESSGSESEAQADSGAEIKILKSDNPPKTYNSPKSKKANIKKEVQSAKKKENKSPSPKKNKIAVKEEKSPKNVIGKTSPFLNSNATVKKERSPSPDVIKSTVLKNKEELKEEKDVKQNGLLDKDLEASKVNDEKCKILVAEVDYNPAKSKYHPIDDACWSKGQAVPYLALAKTLEAIEGTSARLKMVEILSNYFRSVIALTPEDLLPSIYMCLNQLAPAYHSLELGIAETYLMKAVGQSTGRSLAQVRAAARAAGDLAAAAAAARHTQRTLRAPPPLAARHVFAALQDVAAMTGQASVNKKIAKIQTLFVACRHCEAKYLIRSLEGKLRIGLAEQSVLQALAVATATTPPHPQGVTVLDASKGLSTEEFKARVDEHALIIKTTYCECPDYGRVVAALLQHGVPSLPLHCRLEPGTPLKPMLAHPTRGVHEIFDRFEGEQLTCEWKYDGERAQLHVPGDAAPRLHHAAVFSRNQENNTTKYPDVLRRLPSLLKPSVTSCVLDCEAVAYDVANKQILPFQVLSTRKRKDAREEDIKVQVCVFVFDLLYLNGRSLVREHLATRRQLLREHFNQVPGEWQFATSKDCSTMEEVQQFLDEAIRGSCEGLMVKMLTGDNSRYDIARRSHNWLKLKKDYLEGCGDSLDVVVIGGYHGKGKRAGVFGGFLLACYDPDTEEYQSLCKIGTGFSDDDLHKLSTALKEHVIDAPRNYYRFDAAHRPDVWLAAACVWEVRCADLSLSPAHRAARGRLHPDKGLSLRFPRFIRERDDKTPEQATSAQQIVEMYLSQDQVKNQAAKQTSHDDFY
ncbi:DNA ligase 1 [Galleria mellonella]|uniref:DNA ligase n=1 Tax=Galleria mellonella TaxID=7137 RepID=A0ABM3MWA7_GALME|nr:DNA ligase 1 [Galleria mellonella]